ncbi:peroxiredoxin-like family protein [Arthrobacter sp. TmT3-37]|uniref:thioredoxin-dependent peroxiredoxin n=1 Tax=Arthrobacter agilis TaxID=37921 RepID=A0A2L0UIT6_9MICC|nr:peroxiredoxin-like family protein [Arthrobacter agilis]AUZ89143.1 peroxiredoxin [Arthrobacter agilis]
MKQRPAFTNTIAFQIDEYRPTFEAQVGPALAAVFAREQEDLRRAGIPPGTAHAGDLLPDAVLHDEHGRQVRLGEVLGAAAAILVFYRGSWCPYCSIALKTYQRELRPVVEAFGTRLIAISPQAPETAVAAARAAGLRFELYSDEGNALASRLGIVTVPSAESEAARAALGIDVAGTNMDRTAAIPFPTVVVADATGTIRLIDVRVDYTTRTETYDIIEALIAL